MTSDEMIFEDESPEDELSDDDMPDELIEDDLFDEEDVEDDVLLDEEEEASSGAESDEESDADTEALDDLEAEELEMLTDDEASETIVVDEETQLRDIRRAQISIEAGAVGGADDNEFVCSSCFLVKKSSQLANRRKKICLDCAS